MSTSPTLKQARDAAFEIKLQQIFNAISAGNFKEATERLVTTFNAAQVAREDDHLSPHLFDMETIVVAAAARMAARNPDAALNLLTQIIKQDAGLPDEHIRKSFEELLMSEETSPENKVNAYLTGAGIISKPNHLATVRIMTEYLETKPLSKRSVTLAKKILADTRDYWNDDAPEHSDFSPYMDQALETVKVGMKHLSPLDAYEQIDGLFSQHPDLTEIRETTYARLVEDKSPRVSADELVRKLG